MKNLISIFALAILMLSACQQNKSISNPEDYQVYLQSVGSENLDEMNEQIQFWNSKEESNSSTIYKIQLAALYASKFKIDGKVEHLHLAKKLLEEVNEFNKGENAGVLRMLAANAISQHEFKTAYNYALAASEIKDNQFASKLVLFDACMELAYYVQAEGILNELEDKDNFDYKVRLSKWMDYKGDLDQAVLIMEDAALNISPNNIPLQLWTKSNLGDMYGHQGKVDKAYQAYLDVLAIDENYHYALKGIAYIAYANDGKYQEAKNILNYLSKVHPVPDYKLMLAEIASSEEDEVREAVYLKDFYTIASEEKYGKMYNKYLIEIDMTQERFDQAILKAQEEVAHRSTPETYDLLAWTYHLNGQSDIALEIAKKHVENQTYEPTATYHLGVLYKDVEKEKASNFLHEALDAKFELGPNTSKDVQSAISSI